MADRVYEGNGVAVPIVNAAPLTMAEDFIGGVLTEWERAERVLRDIDRENRLIPRAAGEGMYGVDAEGKTTFINFAAERIRGWAADELSGRDPCLCAIGEKTYRFLRRIFSAGKAARVDQI